MKKSVKLLTVAVDDITNGSILAVDLVDAEGNCVFWKERIMYTGDIDFLKENNFQTVCIYPYDLESKKKWLKIISSPQFYDLDEVREVCRQILKNELLIKESNYISLLNNENINVKDILYKYANLYVNNEKIFEILLDHFGANYFHDLMILNFLGQNRSYFLNKVYAKRFIVKLKRCEYYYNLRDRMEDFLKEKFYSFFKKHVISELHEQNDAEEEKRLLNILKILKLEMSEYRKVLKTLNSDQEKSEPEEMSGNICKPHELKSIEDNDFVPEKKVLHQLFQEADTVIKNSKFESDIAEDSEAELKKIENSIIELSEVRKITKNDFSAEFYEDYVGYMTNITGNILSGKKIDYKKFQKKIYKLISEVENSPGILELLLRIKMSSTYIWQHSLNTSLLTLFYGCENKLPDNVLYYLAVSAMFHDIGMIYLDRSIWDHSNELKPSEKLIIEEHPGYGSYILNSHPQFRGYSMLAYEHHEKFKGGGGYPKGKNDRAINNYARLFSIIDSFEAMIFNRSYKQKKTPYEAIKEIINLSGKYYDPKIVNMFIKTFSLYPPGTFIVLNDGRVAKVLSTDKRSIIRPVVALFDKDGSKTEVLKLFENSALMIMKVIDQKEVLSSF